MPILPEKDGREAQIPAGNTSNVPYVTTKTATDRPARGVNRVTALRGPELPAPRMTEKVRKKLSERLFIQDPDLPYAEPEEALRRMIPAGVGQQDRLSGGLLTRPNDVEYRPDDRKCGRHPGDGGGS